MRLSLEYKKALAELAKNGHHIRSSAPQTVKNGSTKFMPESAFTKIKLTGEVKLKTKKMPTKITELTTHQEDEDVVQERRNRKEIQR